MFYLKNFFQIIKQYPLRGFFFFSISFLLIISFTQKNNFEQKVFKSLSSISQNPYFYALVSEKQNYSRIARKVEGLPGVSKVEILGEKQIAKQVSRILSGFKIGLSEDLLSLDYAGLKIVFKKGLKATSHNLIRDYLGRLAGETNVTLGPVQKSKKLKGKKASYMGQIKTWTPFAIIGVVFTLWIISFLWMGQKISKFSYVIEQFQRKERVAFKTTFIGVVLTFATGVLISLFFGTPNLINNAILFIVFALATALQLRQGIWKAN